MGRNESKFPCAISISTASSSVSPRKASGRARDNRATLGGVGRDGNDRGTAWQGDQPGEHDYEVEVPLEELTRMMLEDLALPWLEEKPERQVTTTTHRLHGCAPQGLDGQSRQAPHLAGQHRNAMRPAGSRRSAHLHEDDLRFKVWDEHEEKHCQRRGLYAHGPQWLDDHREKVYRQEFFLLDGAVLAPEVSAR